MKTKIIASAIFTTLSVVSTQSLAATAAITKTATPNHITILSSGNGIPGSTFFGLSSLDFPSGSLTPTKKLTSISYNIASYPGAIRDVLLSTI